MTTRRNPDNLGLILGGLALSGAAIVGLLAWGKSRAQPAAPSAPSSAPGVTPVVLFPDLKVGDTLEIDPVAANVPEPARSLRTLIAIVDLVLADRSVISVRGVGASFAGTIPRSSILKILAAPPPGVFI